MGTVGDTTSELAEHRVSCRAESWPSLAECFALPTIQRWVPSNKACNITGLAFHMKKKQVSHWPIPILPLAKSMPEAASFFAKVGPVPGLFQP